MQLNIHTKVILPHQTQEIAPEKNWYLLRLPQHPETIQLCINRQLKSLIYFSEREDKETSSARIKSYTTESLEVQRITVTLLWIPRWVWLMQSQILAPLSVDPLSPKTESHLGPGMVSIMWNNTTISRWFLDLSVMILAIYFSLMLPSGSPTHEINYTVNNGIWILGQIYIFSSSNFDSILIS